MHLCISIIMDDIRVDTRVGTHEMLLDVVARRLVIQRGLDYRAIRTCSSARECVQLLDEGAIDVLVWDLPHLVHEVAQRETQYNESIAEWRSPKVDGSGPRMTGTDPWSASLQHPQFIVRGAFDEGDAPSHVFVTPKSTLPSLPWITSAPAQFTDSHAVLGLERRYFGYRKWFTGKRGYEVGGEIDITFMIVCVACLAKAGKHAYVWIKNRRAAALYNEVKGEVTDASPFFSWRRLRTTPSKSAVI